MDQEEPIDQQDQPTIGGSSGPITEANTRPQVEATLQADDGMTYTTSTAEVEVSKVGLCCGFWGEKPLPRIYIHRASLF